MQFLDKLNDRNEPERYKSGEPTGRFEMVAENSVELEAIRASLAHLALLAMQSESALSRTDARMLVDFLRLNEHAQGQLLVFPHQAAQLARLIEQGGTSVTPEMLVNQFSQTETAKANNFREDELIREAMNIAEMTKIEVGARAFRKQINEAPEGYFTSGD